MPPPLRAAAALGISYRPGPDEDLPFLAEFLRARAPRSSAPTGWPDEMKLQFLAHQFNAQHTDYERNYPDAEWLVIGHEGEDVGRLYLDRKQPVPADRYRLAARSSRQGSRRSDPSATSSARPGGRKSVTIYVEKNNPARIFTIGSASSARTTGGRLRPPDVERAEVAGG